MSGGGLKVEGSLQQDHPKLTVALMVSSMCLHLLQFLHVKKENEHHKKAIRNYARNLVLKGGGPVYH